MAKPHKSSQKRGESTQSDLAPIARVIRSARETSGLKQEALAEKAGLTRDVIATWERKTSGKNEEALARIAKALGTTAHEIIAEAVGETISYPSGLAEHALRIRAEAQACLDKLGRAPAGADEPMAYAAKARPDAELTEAQAEALRALNELMGVLDRESLAVMGDPTRAEVVLPVLKAMRRGMSGSGAA